MTLRLQTADLRLALRAFSTSSVHGAAATTQDPHVKKLHNEAKAKKARPELELFKQINRLAREGKWNGLEHKPVRWLFGEKATEPYKVYYEKIFNGKYNRYSEQWANGKEVEFVLRIAGCTAFIILVIAAYEYFAPETFKYKYKYGIKQELEERAKHRDSHDGHH
ncbi:hypothetical protein M3Y97_00148200 [Aphelenchoides bicaudatus]|nr:hypothetical protein M3Y97_00148200 [Aphelenchoides bicaudatus]